MNRLERICLERGLRMNHKRRIILEVLDEADDHPCVDDVYKRVIERHRDISIATVYRTLSLLSEAGVLTRLELGDGRTRYEEADGRHHEHLIDVQSGVVLEFREPDIEQLITEAAQRLGYRLVEYRLELFAEPQETTSDPSSARRPYLPHGPPAPSLPRYPLSRRRKSSLHR